MIGSAKSYPVPSDEMLERLGSRLPSICSKISTARIAFLTFIGLMESYCAQDDSFNLPVATHGSLQFLRRARDDFASARDLFRLAPYEFLDSFSFDKSID
jgi:hypothetical protein